MNGFSQLRDRPALRLSQYFQQDSATKLPAQRALGWARFTSEMIRALLTCV